VQRVIPCVSQKTRIKKYHLVSFGIEGSRQQVTWSSGRASAPSESREKSELARVGGYRSGAQSIKGDPT